MRKLYFFGLLLLLSYCTDDGCPCGEPTEWNIEKVAVSPSGGVSIGETLSISISLRDLPIENKWKLSIIVNDFLIESLNINGDSFREFTIFQEYTPTISGTHKIKACLKGNTEEICKEITIEILD